MADDTNNDDITLDAVLSGGSSTQPTSTPQPPNVQGDDVDPDGKPSKPTTPDNNDGDGDGDGQDNSTKLKSLFSSFASDEELDDKNKAIRSKLLEKYQGDGFDEEGNIIKDGQVIQSFDDLLSYIENNDIKKDDKGNQIDEEGNIIKTAYEIAVEETVVNKLHEDSPYQFVDANGETKIYSDDEKGFKEFTDDISQQRFLEFKETFFNQNPVLAEISKHILGGGSIDNFREPFDYSSIDTTKLSQDQKLSLIRDSFEVKELPKEQIDTLLQMFKDGNQVDAQLATAINVLQDFENQMIQNRDLQYQQKVQDDLAKVEQHWEEVEQVITKGDLNTINIPEEEKQGFFSYVSDAVDAQGNSQDMLDASNEDISSKLLVSYLRYKGFDLNKLVKLEANKQKVKSLKELIRESARVTSTPISGSAKGGGVTQDVDITIDALLDQ